jgi:hypothetical protein
MSCVPVIHLQSHSFPRLILTYPYLALHSFSLLVPLSHRRAATLVWEQLNVAVTFKTTQIWILNVGDLKGVETPLEYFMDLAYDSNRWGRDSLLEWLTAVSRRDFGVDEIAGKQVAEILGEYSVRRSILCHSTGANML